MQRYPYICGLISCHLVKTLSLRVPGSNMPGIPLLCSRTLHIVLSLLCLSVLPSVLNDGHDKGANIIKADNSVEQREFFLNLIWLACYQRVSTSPIIIAMKVLGYCSKDLLKSTPCFSIIAVTRF